MKNQSFISGYNSPAKAASPSKYLFSPTVANTSRVLQLSPQVERDSVDIEFKLNHKIAKQLYEKELFDKVRTNREQQDTEREDELAKRLKREQDRARKMDENVKSLQEEKDALRLKKQEKARAVQVNREHGLKVREAELKKYEKKVKERLQKLADEREERVRKLQEDAFARDLDHQRELNNKDGEHNQKARVRIWRLIAM